MSLHSPLKRPPRAWLLPLLLWLPGPLPRRRLLLLVPPRSLSPSRGRSLPCRLGSDIPGRAGGPDGLKEDRLGQLIPQEGRKACADRAVDRDSFLAKLLKQLVCYSWLHYLELCKEVSTVEALVAGCFEDSDSELLQLATSAYVLGLIGFS